MLCVGGVDGIITLRLPVHLRGTDAGPGAL